MSDPVQTDHDHTQKIVPLVYCHATSGGGSGAREDGSLLLSLSFNVRLTSVTNRKATRLNPGAFTFDITHATAGLEKIDNIDRGPIDSQPLCSLGRQAVDMSTVVLKVWLRA